MSIGFKIESRDGAARAAKVTTHHGNYMTPAFMPVGTAATVKGMTPEALSRCGVQVLLANTYHLMLRPGAGRVARLGGVGKMMSWPGPILTDSGGYQVMSLAKLRNLSEEGVDIQSHIDRDRYMLSPEKSVSLQHDLNSTITMVLDECTPFPASENEAATSMRLSMRWAKRCKQKYSTRPGYGIFGIVQGGMYPDLRAESVESLLEVNFDGYAIGGLAVGEGAQLMRDITAHTVSLLPTHKPRYLMGVGRPVDLVEAAAAGCDMFDCVLPTRSGRNGQCFTSRGVVNIRNSRHKDDPRSLDETCSCPTCLGYSRAYLHHLIQAKEMLGGVLLTWHNLFHYQTVMADIRSAIGSGQMQKFREDFARCQLQGDIDPPED